MYSPRVILPYPSAILLATDTAARRSWDTNPNLSEEGKVLVRLYTQTQSLIADCQAYSSRKDLPTIHPFSLTPETARLCVPELLITCVGKLRAWRHSRSQSAILGG
jgi:hypothetical protein